MKLLLLFIFALTLTTRAADTYRAAVVEMWPGPVSPPTNENVWNNAQRIVAECQKASSQGVQIIVFGEDAFTNLEDSYTKDDMLPFCQVLPPANATFSCQTNSNAIENNNDFVEFVACELATLSLTVVIDVPELDVHSGKTYNTQVALERGRLLAAYRKSHLFPGDYKVFDEPAAPASVTFTSFFNVTFGMFICFDVFFVEPAQLLAVDEGVRHFVYSTYFVNDGTTPPAAATQIQSAFSATTHSNLLAANIGYQLEDSGSGLYADGEPVALIWRYAQPGQPDESVVIADLDVHPELSKDSQKRHRNVVRYASGAAPRLPLSSAPPADDDTPTTFSPTDPRFQLIAMTPELSAKMTLRHGRVECRFEFVASAAPLSPPSVNYILMAYDGTMVEQSLPIQFCSAYTCNSSNSSNFECAIIAPPSRSVAHFDDFHVDVAFADAITALPMLVLGDIDGYPMPRSSFTHPHVAGHRATSVDLKSPATMANLWLFVNE
jgi:predicted amidohydrolase